MITFFRRKDCGGKAQYENDKENSKRQKKPWDFCEIDQYKPINSTLLAEMLKIKLAMLYEQQLNSLR